MCPLSLSLFRKGFDTKIISMYARGMSMPEIRDHLLEMYQIDVSAEFISSVTDKVLDEVTVWQNRPLDTVYPILYLDCIVVKVRENNQLINKSLFLAMGLIWMVIKKSLGCRLQKLREPSSGYLCDRPEEPRGSANFYCVH